MPKAATRPQIRLHGSQVPREQLVFPEDEPSLTEQHHKEAVDINNILKKYQETGVFDHVSRHGGDYGFIDGSTFQEQMFQVKKAQEMFMDLPSQARDFFDHDPAKFLDFVDTAPDSAETAQTLCDLGLAPDHIMSRFATTQRPEQSQDASQNETDE